MENVFLFLVKNVDKTKKNVVQLGEKTNFAIG